MIITFLLSIIRILQMLLFIRAIVSWFPDVQRSSIGQMMYRLTEPMLAPIRDFLRQTSAFNSLPIDLSFIVLYFGLDLLRVLLIILF